MCIIKLASGKDLAMEDVYESLALLERLEAKKSWSVFKAEGADAGSEGSVFNLMEVCFSGKTSFKVWKTETFLLRNCLKSIFLTSETSPFVDPWGWREACLQTGSQLKVWCLNFFCCCLFACFSYLATDSDLLAPKVNVYLLKSFLLCGI